MHPTGPDFTEETPLLAGPTSLKNNPFYIYMVAFLSAIGGFLFGYDTGIISGAMIFVREHFDLNEVWQESIVSVTLLSAWLFSIIAGSATDRLGRKPVIIISSFIFVAGSAVMAIANDKYTLLGGRLIVGAGIGLASMTVPMYIAEMAPSGIRGQLVLLNIVCVTGGQFCASIIAYCLSYSDPELAWRVMLGLAAVPATIQFFAFLAMPESPRWLISKLKYDQARDVLRKIRPEGFDTEAELENIRANQQKAKREFEASNSYRNNQHQSTFKRITETPAVSRALIVGCSLQLVQQLAGINTVMYYTASIFEMSGIYSKPKALLMSSITALVNFVFTILGFFLVERLGRRKLILSSLVGVVISLAILGLGFHLAYINGPRISHVDNSTLNNDCSAYSTCSECARDSNCGFCFSTTTESGFPLAQPISSCMRVNPDDHYLSLRGNCSHGTDELKHFVWAYEWCPSSYGSFTLVGLILYLLFFAPGMGPMPWTINSEIYPSWARSWCQSAATSVNWAANLLVSMTFLSLAQLITKHGAFYLYGTFAFLGLIFFTLVLPETRGKSLEELECLFAPKSSKNGDKVDEDGKTQRSTLNGSSHAGAIENGFGNSN